MATKISGIILTVLRVLKMLVHHVSTFCGSGVNKEGIEYNILQQLFKYINVYMLLFLFGLKAKVALLPILHGILRIQ